MTIWTRSIRRSCNEIVAMSLLNDSTNGKGDSWKDATMLVEEGVKYEVNALNSIVVFAGGQGENIQRLAI